MSWDWDKLREQQEKKKKTFGNKPKKPNPGSGGDGGGGRGGGGDIPPQLEDLLKKFNNMKFSGVALIVIVLMLLFFGNTMFFTIKSGTVGVVQRFGKYTRTVEAGLNFKLPDGIEKLTKVNVEQTRTIDFGQSSLSSSNRTDATLMLTGDLNVGLVPWNIQYKISNAKDFLFEVKNPERLLNDLAESSMRLVVGDRSIDEVLKDRTNIADACQVSLQKELDNSKTGIMLINIELGKTNVPPPVQASFNDVNKARQEKDTLIQQAEKQAKKEIPAARGKAEAVVKNAEGYAIDIVNRAEGDAERFTAIYREYKRAKDITRRRLYLDMIQEIFPKIGNKYIIDSSQKNMLPFLNLNNKKNFSNNLNLK